MNALQTALFRFDTATRRFLLAGATGFPDDIVASASRDLIFRLGEERGLIGLVGARRQAHYVANTNSEPRWIPYDPTIRSAHIVPVVDDQDALLGVFVLMSVRVDGFSEEHRALADVRARDIAAQMRLADRLEAHVGGDLTPLSSLAEELRALARSNELRPPVQRDGATGSELSVLSARELDVAGALRRGLRLPEAARVLGMSVHTARNHLKHINAKLNVHSQVELLAALEGHARHAVRQPAARAPLSVLYVEDNPADADLMRRELAHCAPHVSLTLATSIADAKARLSREAESYDAALIDLGLPDGDGLELVRELRTGALALPIVVLTGSDAAQLPLAALTAGANDYWVKAGDYLSHAATALDACIARFRSEMALAAHPLRVLYAEPDIADVNLTQRHLDAHARHITIDVVRSYQALLDRLPRDAQEFCVYDALLIDHRPATRDALDLLKVLRDERGLDLPVVVVSRHGDAEVAAQSLRFGATDYLVKTQGYLVALPAVLRGAHARVQLVREQRALRQREMALREMEARFRVLFEKVAVGVAQIDALHGRFLRANPKYGEILGRTTAELVGLDLGTVTHPDDRDVVLASLRAIHDDDLRENEIEARWLRNDGGMVWVNLKLSAMWGAGEPPTECVVVVEDITERRLTRNVQRILATKLGHLTGDAFYSTAAAEVASLFGVEIGFVGRLIEGTPSRVRMMAMNVDGVAVANVEYETTSTPCGQAMEQHSGVFPHDVRNTFPAPAFLHSLHVAGYAAVALVDLTGRPVGVLGMMSRKPLEHAAKAEGFLRMFAVRAAAELERQRTESRFHALFEFFPDAVLIVDEQGTIIMSNKQSEALLGYTRQELNGMPIDALVPEADRDRHAALRHGFVTQGRSRPMGTGSRLRARRSDGVLVPVEICLSPMPADGRTLIVAAIRDVTENVRVQEERRLLERQLRQAQRLDALGTLAGGIAHDINNLLGVISMGTASTRQQLAPDHGAHRDLEDIGLAVERATSLVRRILTFSRDASSDLKPLVMLSIVDETTKLLRATLPAEVTLSVVGNDTSAIRGDATQIHQVLMNLCTNAWHALEGQRGQIGLSIDAVTLEQSSVIGRVTVPAGSYVHITVSDTGKGMDSATQERMFEPFFTTKAVGQGTGLGLSVVHGIVRSHDGVIAVESAAGHGTRFHVFFPALPNDVLPSTRPIPRASELWGRGLRVLLVEDESALVHVTARVLAQHGHRATVCTDGADALRALRDQPGAFDLIVSDQNMPVMSGLELATELLRRDSHLPFVLASGHVTSELRLNAALVGVSKVLQKPVSWPDLEAAMDELIPPDARPAR